MRAQERPVEPRRRRPARADPPTTPSILWTKLVPPNLPAGFVPRPRLHDLLARGLEGPLTLLSAHPGTGKTVLLTAWAADPARALDVAWMSIDRDDNWAPRFWAGVERVARR